MDFAPGTFQGLAQSEVELFQRVLKGVKGIGVEIGCCDGFSSAHILAASELHLTSIDPFIPDSMEASLVGSKERYLENIAPFGKRARLIVDYSFLVAQPGIRSNLGYAILDQGHSGAIDFLFIDGDHRFPEAMRDFTDWTPLLRKGGLLAMHDARMGREGGAPFHAGPSEVADLMVFRQPDKWEIVGEAFSLVIARKL